MSLSDFLIVYPRSDGFSKVRSALSINKFSNLKSDLKLLALGFGALELIDKTIFENQPDLNIWNLLNRYLEYLNLIDEPQKLCASDVLSLFHSFFVNFIALQGHENRIKSLGRTTISSYLNKVNNFVYADFNERLGSLQFLKEVIK